MMKLAYSATSPFVRKVLVIAIETGQDAEIERLSLNPTDPAFAKINPLNKVPALILEDGTPLFDSAVICEYLDARKQGGFFPASGAARWSAITRQALADGVMDAALLRRYEVLRPENLRSADWDAKQKLKMEQGLDALERDVGAFATFDIGAVTTACMLDYLDFRFAAEGWRNHHPHLAAWHTAISQRPSLAGTKPKE
jgi:glutathione S-transferase